MGQCGNRTELREERDMETIKKCKNVEFEVIYDDGTRKRVREGVLFEADGNSMILHNGTNRASVLFAARGILADIIDGAGLGEVFDRYLAETFGEGGQVDGEGKQ